MIAIMKKIIICFTLLAILMTLSSCKTDAPVDPQVSCSCCELSQLKLGEFDNSIVEDGIFARTKTAYYVGNSNGKLSVSHIRIGNIPNVLQSKEFSFDSILGNARGVYIDGEVVIQEKCIGILPNYDQDKLLVFTVNGVYLFEKTQDNWLLSNKYISISGAAMIYTEWENMAYDAPEKVYLITKSSVIVLDTYLFLNENAPFSGISMTTIPVPDWFAFLSPTSAVLIESTLYIGDKHGIASFNFDTEDYRYYSTKQE